jgi:hypothetical protein
MCKAVSFFAYDFTIFPGSYPYIAGECNPGTYGLTITLACIDDDDIRVNHYCPASAETCQVAVVAERPDERYQSLILRKVIVNDNCHVKRANIPTSSIMSGLFYVFAFDNFYPCACSSLLTMYYTPFGYETFYIDGDQTVVEIPCVYYNGRFVYGGPYYICNVPLGTVMESFCIYNESPNVVYRA